MHDRTATPLLRAAAIVAIAAVVAGCGGTASPSSAPTLDPSLVPSVAPTVTAGGPLASPGPLGPATYETPAGFRPAFRFDLRTDGWRAVIVDETGFTLVTPSATRIEALLGVTTPVAATVEAFEAELRAGGYLAAGAVIGDVSVGGLPARSFAVELAVPAEAYRMTTPDGEVTTSFGGDLSHNELIFVADPVRPFVLDFSAAPGPVEARFAFEALVASIAFLD